MKKYISQLVMLLLTASPLIYLAIVWDSLPRMVALHFDINFKPDRMGEKSELIVIVGVLAAVGAAIYLLLTNLNRIDPKRIGKANPDTFRKLAVVLVAFIIAINFLLIASSVKGVMVLQRFLFLLVGLLIAFTGNYMNSIKPNYFAGFRLPWTLNDTNNWRRTHLLASKLWFAGGLLIMLVGLIVPHPVTLVVLFTVFATITLIPGIYSYRLFKKKTASTL